MRRVVVFVPLLITLCLIPTPAGADTSFAKYDSNGSCDFWLARHNVASPDGWSAGSAHICPEAHSMSASVDISGFGDTICTDTGTNFAKCTVRHDPGSSNFHSHSDNDDGSHLNNSTSWQSSD